MKQQVYIYGHVLGNVSEFNTWWRFPLTATSPGDPMFRRFFNIFADTRLIQNKEKAKTVEYHFLIFNFLCWENNFISTLVDIVYLPLNQITI